MPSSPDIPVLASDLLSRLVPWSKTNISLLSQWEQDGQFHLADEQIGWYLQPSLTALVATLYRGDPTLEAYRDLAIEAVEAGFAGNFNTPTMWTPSYVYAASTSYPNSLFHGLPNYAKQVASFDGGPWGTPDIIGSDENGTIETIAAFCWILDALYFNKDGDPYWETDPDTGISLEMALDWLDKIKIAANWLIDFNGNPIWFTNGNYVVHQCLAYAHLAKMCRMLGDAPGWTRFSQAYELSMQTLIYPFGNNAPANAQWAEYGYTVDVAGTQSSGTGTGPSHAALLLVGGTVSDGSTEQGHLTETPSHSVITPGVTNTFDGVYAQLQLDCLSCLLLVNRDWRVNYMLNALWNKLETITDFTAYTITTTGGSRNPGVSIRGWTGGYQNIIALLGRRASNRTNITNVKCLGAWDNMIATNLSNGITIGQLGTFQARQWRVAVAASIQACYQVEPKV